MCYDMGVVTNISVTCHLCILPIYVMHVRGLCCVLPDAKSCYTLYF